MTDTDFDRRFHEAMKERQAEEAKRRSKLTPEELAAEDAESDRKAAEYERENRVSMAVPSDLDLKLDERGHELWRLRREFQLDEDPYTKSSLEARRASGNWVFGYRLQRANLDEAQKDLLVNAFEVGVPLAQPINFTDPEFADLNACHYCGGGTELWTDGFIVWPADECPHPNGITMQVKLEVPSGKILVTNDLRAEFAPANDADYDVNAAYGIQQTVEAYEKAGMLHFFVGNSCPGVYQRGSNDFIIASPPSEDVLSEDELKALDATRVAVVVTDLWWVSMSDYDDACQRGWRATDHWCNEDVIEVEPGTYTLTYHGIEKDFNRDDYENWIVYAELQLDRTNNL